MFPDRIRGNSAPDFDSYWFVILNVFYKKHILWFILLYQHKKMQRIKSWHIV